jgi:hypothetical protein
MKCESRRRARARPTTTPNEIIDALGQRASPSAAREVFEAAVAPALRNPDSAVHAYSLPVPEAPEMAWRAPALEIPAGARADPDADGALAKVGMKQPQAPRRRFAVVSVITRSAASRTCSTIGSI